MLKIGGDIFKKGLTSAFCFDIKKKLHEGNLILVHGGGDEVTSIAENLGKSQVFITSPGGIKSRYTDLETVEIFTMVMAGRINKFVVRWLLNCEINAIGISGLDGAMMQAKRKKRLIIIDERNRKRIIDGGYTGKIFQIDIKVLKMFLKNGYLPVIAPIALGEEGEFLNVDSDRAAAQIAGAINAKKIIFLTDVPGLKFNNKYIKKLSLDQSKKILPKIGAGMDKKILASIEALNNGVKEAIISSGFQKNPLTNAINHINCTVITLE